MQKNKIYEKLLLLDTHVWIWLLNGDNQLKGTKTLFYINQAAKEARLRVSSISVWETGMLEAKGRIRFSVDCLDWVNQALSAPGISLVPLTPGIAIASTRLPGEFHGDPADRIIVSTARKLSACLVSKDSKILAYGNEKYLDVLGIK
ncbi:MAG: type II toxin-antitoxin system VapC family toxin [Candidatus Eremiobacterota bacterium]